MKSGIAICSGVRIKVDFFLSFFFLLLNMCYLSMLTYIQLRASVSGRESFGMDG